MSERFPVANGFEPDYVPLEAPDPCSVCDGRGREEPYIEGACCGSYLATGECCAALYGADRLVPVEVEGEPCPACGGTGTAP